MADLIEKFMFPNDPESIGIIHALLVSVLSLLMLAGSCTVLFAMLFPVALFALIVLLMIIDGVFGTHLFEAFNSIILLQGGD